MVEHVTSAVVGEVVSTAASFLTSKFDELTGVSDKVQRLEWKLVKIQSAIEESNKYDIENGALQKMQQELIDVAQEVNAVIQEFKNCSSAPGPQSLDQTVVLQNPSTMPDPQHLDRSAALQNPIITSDPQSLDQTVALQNSSTVSDPQHLDPGGALANPTAALPNPVITPDPQSLDQTVALQNSSTVPDPQQLDQGGALLNPIIASDPQHLYQTAALLNPVSTPDPQRLDQTAALPNPVIMPDPQRLGQTAALVNPIIMENELIAWCKSRICAIYVSIASSIEPPVSALASFFSIPESAFLRLFCSSESQINLSGVVSRPVQLLHHRVVEIQKLNRILERIEGISGDIGDYLEMLRHQKRKRGRRRRYRPYLGFFKLAYLELAQDALAYCWGQVSWAQFLVPQVEIGTSIETKAVFSLKAGSGRLAGYLECQNVT